MQIINILLFLILGAYSLAGIITAGKIKSTADYYVMSEKAPTLFLVGSLCASYMSAVTMGAGAGEAYARGPIMMLLTGPLGAWCGMIIAVLFIGRRLKALGCYTLPDFFTKRFSSREVTFVATLIMIVGLLLYGISQLMAAGYVLSSVTGMTYGTLILIFVITLLLFCVPAGMWGVMLTDTLMFVPILIGSLILCPMILNNIGIENFTTNLPAALDNFWLRGGFENKPISWSVSQFLVWMMFFACSPMVISRVFPARNDFAVIKACLISVPLIAVMVTLVYITAGAMNVTDAVVPYSDAIMVTAYTTQIPGWLGAIGIVAIICAIISTASSLFSIVGFGLSRDLYNISGNIDDDTERENIKRGRIAQAVVIIFAGIIAYLAPITIYNLSVFASAIFAVGWLPVIFLALVWPRMNSLAAFSGMSVGITSLCILTLLTNNGVIVWPSWMNLYLLSIILAFVATISMGLLFRPTHQEMDCYYRILNTHLSDLMTKELRRFPGALETLLREYRSTKRTAWATFILFVSFWVLLLVWII